MSHDMGATTKAHHQKDGRSPNYEPQKSRHFFSPLCGKQDGLHSQQRMKAHALTGLQDEWPSARKLKLGRRLSSEKIWNDVSRYITRCSQFPKGYSFNRFHGSDPMENSGGGVSRSCQALMFGFWTDLIRMKLKQNLAERRFDKLCHNFLVLSRLSGL